MIHRATFSAVLGVALVAALAIPPSGARAATSVYDDERWPLPIWFTLQGGPMFPSGDEGSGLRRGPQGAGSIGYQVGESFHVAGELGMIGSTDVFRTRVIWAGFTGRLNPDRALPALYVQGGGALYQTSYHVPSLARFAPPSRVRPGLSFGVGYDAMEFGRVTFGVLGNYHGIVIARGDALSYLTLGLYASLRPAYW